MEAKYPRRESNSEPPASETGALSAELRGLKILSGYPDSNRGPFAPKANALPSCATPRFASLRPTRALVPAEGFEPPHPRDLIYSQARLAICAVPAWWSRRDSNPRHPRCRRGALPLSYET